MTTTSPRPGVGTILVPGGILAVGIPLGVPQPAPRDDLTADDRFRSSPDARLADATGPSLGGGRRRETVRPVQPTPAERGAGPGRRAGRTADPPA